MLNWSSLQRLSTVRNSVRVSPGYRHGLPPLALLLLLLGGAGEGEGEVEGEVLAG
jgi:hypothetical protein